jgi:hypothetical protein
MILNHYFFINIYILYIYISNCLIAKLSFKAIWKSVNQFNKKSFVNKNFLKLVSVQRTASSTVNRSIQHLKTNNNVIIVNFKIWIYYVVLFFKQPNNIVIIFTIICLFTLLFMIHFSKMLKVIIIIIMINYYIYILYILFNDKKMMYFTFFFFYLLNLVISLFFSFYNNPSTTVYHTTKTLKLIKSLVLQNISVTQLVYIML